MNRWYSVSFLMLALAVTLGAFCAHVLQPRLSAYHLDIFNKAVFYHFIHAISMVLVLTLASTNVVSEDLAVKCVSIFFFGIVVFSGSLYLLAITDIKILGAITPLGGLSFIAGWLVLAYNFWK